MMLRGIDFGRVNVASGTLGFFGRGYWYHRGRGIPAPLSPDFTGAGFAAKTTTLHAREGQMRLLGPGDDFEPADRMPNCIAVNFRDAIGVNSVGLSGPGAEALLAQGKWQRRRKPFMLSFMSVAQSTEEKLRELREFVSLLRDALVDFQAPIALQINFSCPNTGHQLTSKVADLVQEIERSLEIASPLDIPLLPKINVLLPPEAARRISLHPACDAICVSNTLPWDDTDPAIRLKHFGTVNSPLEGRTDPFGKPMGKGGLSGAPLFPYLVRWLMEAQQEGLSAPLNVGGGILSLEDAEQVLRISPPNSSVFLGSIAFLRPWRVGGIVRNLTRS